MAVSGRGDARVEQIKILLSRSGRCTAGSKICDKITNVDPKRVGHRLQCPQGDISFTPLYCADLGTVESGDVGKFVLAPILSLTIEADSLANRFLGIGILHQE